MYQQLSSTHPSAYLPICPPVIHCCTVSYTVADVVHHDTASGSRSLYFDLITNHFFHIILYSLYLSSLISLSIPLSLQCTTLQWHQSPSPIPTKHSRYASYPSVLTVCIRSHQTCADDLIMMILSRYYIVQNMMKSLLICVHDTHL